MARLNSFSWLDRSRQKICWIVVHGCSHSESGGYTVELSSRDQLLGISWLRQLPLSVIQTLLILATPGPFHMCPHARHRRPSSSLSWAISQLSARSPCHHPVPSIPFLLASISTHNPLCLLRVLTDAYALQLTWSVRYNTRWIYEKSG